MRPDAIPDNLTDLGSVFRLIVSHWIDRELPQDLGGHRSNEGGVFVECLPQLVHDLLKLRRLRRQCLGTQLPNSVWGRTELHMEPDVSSDSSECQRGNPIQKSV